MSKKKVIIIGAGSAGLMAGWELSNRGYKVVILEVGSQVGGLCQTVKRGNFRFDLGGHRFVSNDLKFVEKIKSLMGDRLIVQNRKSIILFNNKEILDLPPKKWTQRRANDRIIISS